MILINEVEFDRQNFDDFLFFLEDEAVTPEKRKYFLLFKNFLEDCWILDEKLQKEVSKKVGNNFICYTIPPSTEFDDFSTLEFRLSNKNGKKVGTRDTLIFEQICEDLLKNFVSFEERAA